MTQEDIDNVTAYYSALRELLGQTKYQMASNKPDNAKKCLMGVDVLINRLEKIINNQI